MYAGHLLRELHTRRDEATTSETDFAIAPEKLSVRPDTFIFTYFRNKDCQRINKRLIKHREELFCFLEVESVPA